MAIITPTPLLVPKPGPFPAGRRCAEPDCITVLCRWHEGPYCFAHEPEHLDELIHEAKLRRLAA